MSEQNNQEYYLSRATTSRQLAERAIDPSIAAIDTDLATRYERLAGEPRTKDTDSLAVT